jgi:signal peptidase I
LTRIRTIGSWTAGLFAGLAVLAIGVYALLLVQGYKPVVVYSGSMEPTLHVGSLTFIRPVPATDVRVGDVITFTDPYRPERLVTHRVVRIVERPGGAAYRTKGDANPARDPWTISLPGHVGLERFSVPYVGYGLVVLQERTMRMALILLFSTFLLFTLLRRIWRSDPEGSLQS